MKKGLLLTNKNHDFQKETYKNVIQMAEVCSEKFIFLEQLIAKKYSVNVLRSQLYPLSMNTV